jgi:protein pelota
MAFYDDFCVKSNNSKLRQNKSKFLKAHTSSGHKRAIDEMLADPNLNGQLQDVKAAGEVQALHEFHTMLNDDEDRVCYGFDSVSYADDMLAVDKLLITDRLFKAIDIVTRQKYVSVVESVKDHGGKVLDMLWLLESIDT